MRKVLWGGLGKEATIAMYMRYTIMSIKTFRLNHACPCRLISLIPIPSKLMH